MSTTTLTRPSKSSSNGSEPRPWVPRADQQKAVRFLLSRLSAALFLDPSLGKTADVLQALTIQKRVGRIKALVVATPTVCQLTWPGELEKWENFQHLDWVYLHGPKKEQLLWEDHDIYLINYEGLAWLLGGGYADPKKKKTTRSRVNIDEKRLKALGFTHLILDELSFCKNYSSLRFKMLKKAVKFFKYRYGLTGSPAANGLMGLFAQCYVLDDGATLGTGITKFREEYFYLKDFWNPHSWELKEGAEERIYKRIAPLALRMAAEDYVKLPPFLEKDILVPLPEKFEKLYKEMEREMYIEVRKHKVLAMSTAGALNKCRQILNGSVYLDRDSKTLLPRAKSDRETLHLHNAKLDALQELVDELQGQPLLVTYEFDFDREAILKRFKDAVFIGKGVKPTEKRSIEERWNRGDIQILVGHASTVARGINIQFGGNRVCLFSPTYDYEVYDQLIRRFRRVGATFDCVFVYRLIGVVPKRRTIDQQACDALVFKEKTQTKFYEGLNKYGRSNLD